MPLSGRCRGHRKPLHSGRWRQELTWLIQHQQQIQSTPASTTMASRPVIGAKQFTCGLAPTSFGLPMSKGSWCVPGQHVRAPTPASIGRALSSPSPQHGRTGDKAAQPEPLESQADQPVPDQNAGLSAARLRIRCVSATAARPLRALHSDSTGPLTNSCGRQSLCLRSGLVLIPSRLAVRPRWAPNAGSQSSDRPPRRSPTDPRLVCAGPGVVHRRVRHTVNRTPTN